ncbi:unnamed protein product [Arabis nemorensis]|uniref:Transmembrane protein n=1 Tax=Arabis nemorensis TaxID=586526 RepID=A0A565BID9_9BRAS|nr:unnamed protein product [Arabis nemorensis]
MFPSSVAGACSTSLWEGWLVRSFVDFVWAPAVVSPWSGRRFLVVLSLFGRIYMVGAWLLDLGFCSLGDGFGHSDLRGQVIDSSRICFSLPPAEASSSSSLQVLSPRVSISSFSLRLHWWLLGPSPLWLLVCSVDNACVVLAACLWLYYNLGLLRGQADFVAFVYCLVVHLSRLGLVGLVGSSGMVRVFTLDGMSLELFWWLSMFGRSSRISDLFYLPLRRSLSGCDVGYPALGIVLVLVKSLAVFSLKKVISSLISFTQQLSSPL